MHYDVIIVGAGLFGAVLCRSALDHGKSVLVVEKRAQIGGNVYTETVEGITVHKYGAHIFHTDNEAVWSYVNRYAAFDPYIHSPVANFRGKIYSLPFNLKTFREMWGNISPDEAREKIAAQSRESGIQTPRNLEEQAISLVGTDIYHTLIAGYTAKQWGRDCKDLPASIIRRIPVRFTENCNYFNSRYQGIPRNGYTPLVENLLTGADVVLNCDYLSNRKAFQGDFTVYTGPIDAYYDYRFGDLQYRSVRFETRVLPQPDFQGHAVVNFTDAETPFTRIIEHRYFDRFCQSKSTVISYEYSAEHHRGIEPYYPINDDKNMSLYQKYRTLAETESGVLFGGRLAEYKYYDMDQVIFSALQCAEKLF